MFEKIGKRIEKTLMDEIENIDAAELEEVGTYLVEAIEGKRLENHGINKNGKPVGHTVDSYTDDATIVAEFSTDKDYFTDPSYKKISKDIQHANSHGGQKLEKIYLISSQEENPSFRKAFNETQIFKDNSGKINILDARIMAQKIYRLSKDYSEHAKVFKMYFPDFAQQFDNYAYYGNVPPQCNNYCKDDRVIREIDKHFKKGNYICVLYGVSGAGKTQSVIQYVNEKHKEYQNYIWITGEDWRQGTSLSSVQRLRGGEPINIVGSFCNYKTLMVIDSLERTISLADFEELKNGFEKGGKIIITSQRNLGDAFCLQMPEISDEVAWKILGDENNDSPNAKELVEICKGIPLILSTIRNIIEYENLSKEDLYREVLQKPEELMTTDGTVIVRKILSQLPENSREQLQKIANSGMTTFDIDFLRKYCSILGCNALQRVSILLKTNVPGLVKVHDLICKAMRERDDSAELVKALEEYIGENKGEMTPSILRQIYLLRDHIRNYKNNSSKAGWLTYALLQIEGNEKNDVVEALYKKEFRADMDLAEEKCLVEAKELWGYQQKGKEAVNLYLTQLISEYLKAKDLYEDEDRKAEILHHLGKAYKRKGEIDKAYECFKELLKVKPDWHATYAQIVMIGTKKGASDQVICDGQYYMRLLLAAMLKNADEVPLRVSLVTISKMTSYRNVALEIIRSEEAVNQICRIVAGAALDNIGQFFEGFVAVSSLFSYEYSESCLELAECVPSMFCVQPETIDSKQWINACEALSNLAQVAQREHQNDLFEMLITKSHEFGEAYLKEKKGSLNLFANRAIAKSYNISGDGERALEVIEMIPIEKRDHWMLYRQAEAENLLGKPEAIQSAQKAIELLNNDKKNESRKASYYHLLSKCYKKNNEIEKALREIEKAIFICKSDKYKAELRAYENDLKQCR